MFGFGWVKKIFKRSADKVRDVVVVKPDPVTAGEQALKDWHVEYLKQKDGTLVVPGNLNVSNRGMTELPDLSNVIVEGNFSCLKNNLTSLKGAPRMFASLISDFGVFWEGHIPEHLRQPPPPKKIPATGAFDF